MRNFTNGISKLFILFNIGGLAYVIIELLWRGSSHGSMFVLGGLCFVIIGLMNERKSMPLLCQMLIGTFIITSLELMFGYILNIRLHLDVWDYSDMPFNILGQICLPYMCLWFILSFFCIVIDDNIRFYIFGEEKRRYTLI